MIILDRAALDAALNAALSLAVLDPAVPVAAAAAIVLAVALAAYRLGVRHREARAQRLRERLVGRLHPGAP